MIPAGLRLLLVADFQGPTQYISFHSPLAPMIRQGDCQVTTVTEQDLYGATRTKPSSVSITPEQVMFDCFEEARRKSTPNLVVFSRYGGPLAARMLKVFRELRVPIIAHLDDDLLGVPAELGPDKYRRYNDPARLMAIRTVLENSDLIYASTPALAERLRQHGVGVPIVAGKIYCSSEPSADVSYREPPVVGYMGSGGHAHDLAIALPGIVRLLDARPEVRFELFGTIPMPERLRSYGTRVAHHPFNSDYPSFLRELARLGWSIGLAPLADIPFNAVKANTKWVEYASAGVAVIASDHPVYRTSCATGCGILATDDGWYSAINRLLDQRSEREEMIIRARRRLEDEFRPEILRSQLLSIFVRGGADFSVTTPEAAIQEPRLS